MLPKHTKHGNGVYEIASSEIDSPTTTGVSLRDGISLLP